MRSFVSALAIAAIGALSPGLAQSESLGDALASAYRQSNLLEQQRATLRAADEDAASAVAALRPVIDFTVSGQWKKYDNATALPQAGLLTPNYESSNGLAQLTASWLIWGNGRGQIARQLAAENVQAVRAALVNVEQQVLLGALSAYVDLQLQSELVELRQANLRLITKQLRAAQDRFDLGDATQTDVNWAKARLAGASAQLAAAQAAQRSAAVRYQAATGLTPGRLARLPKLPKLPASLEEATAMARASHPMVLQSRHMARMAQLQLDMANANLGPTLTGQIGLESNLNSGIQDQFATLQFKQTLYKGGDGQADYRKAFAQLEAAAAGVQETQLTVASNVAAAWNNLLAAGVAIEAGDAQVRATSSALEGVREESQLGSKSTLDVLNAENELMSARVSLAQSRASRYLAAYQLLATTGRLTASNLSLDVPVYDPDIYSNQVKSAPVTHSPQGDKLDRVLKKIGG